MPIKRKYMKKRNGRKYATKRDVNKIVNANIETKYQDTQFTSQGVSNATAPLDITIINVGSEVSQRVGNQIKVTSFRYRYVFSLADTGLALDIYNILRIIVFKWNVDTNNTLPTIGAVLNTAGIAGQNFPMAQYNSDNIRSGKVVIMSDKHYKTDDVSNRVVLFKKTVRIRKRWQKVRFDTDPASTEGYGKFFLLVCTDSGILPHPIITGTGRLLYKDG